MGRLRIGLVRWTALAGVIATTAGPTCSEAPEVEPNEHVDPFAHVCERWGRARPGASWTYDTTGGIPDDPTWLQRAEYSVRTYDLAAEKLELQAFVRITGELVDTDLDAIHQYRCDDEGMWALGGSQDSTAYFTDGSSSVDHASWSYDPPKLIFPAEVKEGTRWQQKSLYSSDSAKSGHFEALDDLECVARPQEPVTTSLGEYFATPVACGAVGSTPGTTWYVDGIGAVKSGDTTELVDFLEP